MEPDLRSAEILEGVHDYIMTNGWLQGAGYAFDGTDHPAACVVGAANFIERTNLNQRCSAYGWILRVAGLTIFLPNDHAIYVHLVTAWNDDPERSLDEVLDVLVKAAHNAREGLE